MKKIKRLISIILVLSMFFGLMVSASAATEDVSLAVFKEDGTALDSSEAIHVGDTVSVKLSVNKELTSNTANFLVWYDKTAFSFDPDASSYSANVKSAFVRTYIKYAETINEATEAQQAKLDAGFLPAMLTVTNLGENATIPSGEWATLQFTALKEVASTQIQAEVREILQTVDGDSNVEISDMTSGSVTVTIKEVDVPATGVSLSQNSLSINVGSTEKLTATVEPDNTTDAVTWLSSDSSIASVSTTGEVTAVSAGTARITVSAGEVSAYCDVTVIEVIPATAVSLNRETAAMDPGESLAIRATVSPSNTTDAIIWSSDNEAVCTITPNATNPSRATIKAVSLGTAHITVTVGDCSKTCDVTVRISVKKVTLDKTSATIKAGKTLQLNATIEPENPTDPSITWSSSAPEVASVDENGLVTGLSNGTARITVKSVSNENRTAACSVTVVAVAEGNYTVKLAEDISGASVGETILIPVTIGSKDTSVTSYNAYRMVLSYDEEVLEFISADSSSMSKQFTAVSDSGEIIVSDYGESKNLGEAFVLKFNAVGATETAIVAKEAQIDIGENAISENAPEAVLEDPDTVITFADYYTVTIPDDYSTEMSTTVAANGSITFSVKDYDPYYNYTVSATMNGESVKITDNKDGSYTISNITGNVVVEELQKTGKSFDVEFSENLSEVSGESTAVYGTDYSFTVTEEEGFTYAVSVKIGDTAYTLGEPIEGKYTISGSEIKDKITVSVVKTEKPVTYSVTLGEGATGNATATKGIDYSFTIEESDDYTWQVSVTIAGAEYTAYSVSGNVYTIPGADITGEIVISTEKGEKVYSVKFIQVNGAEAPAAFYNSKNVRSSALEQNDTAVKGQEYVFHIEYKSYYAYEMEVTMGGESITPVADKEHSLTTPNPFIGYTIENVNGDIEIKITRYMNLEVKFFEYLQLDGQTVYLVLASEANMGRTIFYHNMPLYNASKYNTITMDNGMAKYAWLVIADENFDKEAFATDLKLHSINLWAGSGAQPSTALSATNDVNSSGIVDINDAQLVYDIYNGKYDSFDIVTMKKFLQADVNADTKVDVTDAAAVVKAIN